MKIKLLFALLFIYGWSAAQIKFETGYFISNSGEKTEVLIKDLEWNANPTYFEYKNSESDVVKTRSIKDVKEFRAYNGAKFVRADVKIDRSGQRLGDLNHEREPAYKDETVFLQELVDGKVRLYKHSDGSNHRYFYRIEEDEITPLTYKPYLVKHDQVGHNMDFQKQLEKSFTCKNETQRKFTDIKHEERELVKLFVAQNQCLDPDFVQAQAIKSDKFNLNIRPRVNFSSLTFTRSSTDLETDLGNQVNFGIGLEFEYILPFHKNKWAIIVEPNYHYFKSTVTQDLNYSVPATLQTSVDYKTIELPLGIRYYMHLSPDSKLFVNAQYIIDIPMNSEAVVYRNDNSLLNTSFELGALPAVAFGFGYNFRSKYAAEFRFFTNRSIVAGYSAYSSDYNSASLILSYNLF